MEQKAGIVLGILAIVSGLAGRATMRLYPDGDVVAYSIYGICLMLLVIAWCIYHQKDTMKDLSVFKEWLLRQIEDGQKLKDQMIPN